jgi:hypothetical protein
MGDGRAPRATQAPRAAGPRPATLSGRSVEDEFGGGENLPPIAPLPDEVPSGRRRTPRVVADNHSSIPGRLRTLEPEPAVEDESDAGEPGSISPPGGAESNREGREEPGDRPSGAGGRSARPMGAPRGSVGVSLGESGGAGDPGDEPQRGGRKRWGQARRRAGIGLERKLEIHVRPERLLIGPGDAVVPVGRGEKSDQLLGKVLAGIEQVAEGWGAPPANFYWLPAVRFVVYPGGNTHYERLRGPLQKWGVNSTVEYAGDEDAVRAASGGRR